MVIPAIAPRYRIVPVPMEHTTCYGHGTRRGPRAILDAQLQMFLRRLETFNNAVIAQAKAYYDSELASDKLRYSEALMRDMANRTSTIIDVLQDLGTQDNPFAAQFAQHFVDMWQRGTAEIFNQYGY